MNPRELLQLKRCCRTADTGQALSVFMEEDNLEIGACSLAASTASVELNKAEIGLD